MEMFGDTMLMTQTIAKQTNSHDARRWAAERFQKVLWKGELGRFLRRLTGRRTTLKGLPERKAAGGGQTIGLREVALDRIVGSEGRTHDFDADFRPTHTDTQDRWIGIAAARRNGIGLPPVDLIQIGDEYFVRDGNHRVSVARALGEATIEAVVTRWGE
jgi:hypothetical protein